MSTNIISFAHAKSEQSFKDFLKNLPLKDLLQKAQDLTVIIQYAKLNDKLINECNLVLLEFSKRIEKNQEEKKGLSKSIGLK